MSRVPTNSADDVGGKIALLGAVILAMTDLTTYGSVSKQPQSNGGGAEGKQEILTVLASLVFIVSKCTVECCEFAELVTLELILSFGDRGSLEMWQVR